MDEAGDTEYLFTKVRFFGTHSQKPCLHISVRIPPSKDALLAELQLHSLLQPSSKTSATPFVIALLINLVVWLLSLLKRTFPTSACCLLAYLLQGIAGWSGWQWWG